MEQVQIGRQSRMAAWEGKTVLVTGGSAGLGKAIAREFGRRGAQVVCVARDADRLRLACQQLKDEGIQAEPLSLDVTDPEQVERGFADIAQRFGHLDVLVNCVGRSTRSDIMKLKMQDFRELMEVNFFSLVNCTQTALPYLVESQGCCINIGSLSAKTAWPYMAPYTASKFAVAAYTHQLRIEGPAGVHFMLVCPGPIRRTDAGSRYEEVAADLPVNARAPGAGAKLRGICPEELARRIVCACEKRKAELITPWSARILFVISHYSPRIGDWILRKMIK